MAVLSFASRSSYVPWKIASTLILLWLALKPSTIFLTASPFTPDIACHHVMVAAGATSLAGARPLMSPLLLAAGPPPPVLPPQAAAATMIARPNAASLRIFPSVRAIPSPLLQLDRGSIGAVPERAGRASVQRP